MNTESLIGIFSAIGIGGIIGAIIQSKLDRQKELLFKLNSLNEEKFRTLLIYMSFVLDSNNPKHFIMNDTVLSNLNQEEISKYSMEKIKEYYYHSLLYASDDVIIHLKKFIKTPDRNHYIKVAKAMRKSLWNKKSKITLEEIEIKM